MSDEARDNLNDAQDPPAQAPSAQESAFSVLPMLGPVAWLYTKVPEKRFMFFSDAEWAVIPALVLNQCRLFFKGSVPVAFVSWALVNDEVQAALLSGRRRMKPEDWNSGSHLWLMDVLVPFGGVDEVLRDVQEKHFPGQDLRFLAMDESTASVRVATFPYAAPLPEESLAA